jgi:nitroimidazol reductase NimA-like FMN-containing flavoprotein (pyridoxamine 5'-phosphate oxidase superfamily)
MSIFSITHRNEIKRLPERAHYEESTIYSIIDEALYCHVGFIQENQPFVIPTLYARMEDNIILHGSKISRLMQHIHAGNEICIAITILDGLVLARSAYHHSMNYRSVVLFGRGKPVQSDEEKQRALQALMDHMMPGRWDDIRKPNQKELDATMVVSIPIEDASAKIRKGPPIDDGQDDDFPLWVGLIPMYQATSPPQSDPKVKGAVSIPEYILQYER